MATNGGMYLSAPTPIAGTVYLFHGEATVVASPNDVRMLRIVAGTVYLFRVVITIIATMQA